MIKPKIYSRSMMKLEVKDIHMMLITKLSREEMIIKVFGALVTVVHIFILSPTMAPGTKEMSPIKKYVFLNT